MKLNLVLLLVGSVFDLFFMVRKFTSVVYELERHAKVHDQLTEVPLQVSKTISRYQVN